MGSWYDSYNVTQPMYKAFAEVGNAEKTIFLCDYLVSREVQRGSTRDSASWRTRTRPMTSTAMVVRANSPRIAGNLVPDFQPQFIAY